MRTSGCVHCETLDIYQAHQATKTLRPKSTPMQRHRSRDTMISTSTRRCTRNTRARNEATSILSFDGSGVLARLQFAATWVRFDTSYAVGQLARFCASAGPSHMAAHHHPMEHLDILASSWIITRIRRMSLDSMGAAMRTGELARADGPSLVTSFVTTELRSHDPIMMEIQAPVISGTLYR